MDFSETYFNAVRLIFWYIYSDADDRSWFDNNCDILFSLVCSSILFISCIID